MALNLADQFNPVEKPQHKRNKPKRGNHTKFSPKVRKIIIARDDGLCVRCKRPYHNIHHITFASAGGEGHPANGVCVCGECHAMAHKCREYRKWFEDYQEKHLIPKLLEELK
jgi:5-methylcytosine-specific restriction endonuclease McrA